MRFRPISQAVVWLAASSSPTHRALARALDIVLTTVTRAYGEALRRGLIDARVCHGTFLSETTARVAADIHYQVKTDLLSAPQWTRGA